MIWEILIIYLFPVNLSSQFSIESVRDELSQDQIWLVDSSSQYQKKQQQSTTNSFRNILDGVTKPLLRKKNFLILEYTNVFFQPKFCGRRREEIFNSAVEKCEYQNCAYTCGKTSSVVTEADALLFHQRDLETEYEVDFNLDFARWLQNTKQLPFKTTQAKQTNNPDQIWILWNDEATKVQNKFNEISQLFNWTLSYRSRSEVYKGTYGFLKLTQSIDSVEDLLNLKRNAYLKEFVKRKNAILWFVSNCKSKERLKIALEISKFYPVHIYTKCQQLEVDLKSTTNEHKHLHIFHEPCLPNSQCETQKLQSFKYYLAFENTNCSSYITEKLWRSLNKHIIPIILQPTRDSYAQYRIPAKSIIHLEDFDYKPQLLADYLNKIDVDFVQYYQHLKWTYVYLRAFYESEFSEPHRMCELCKMLNEYEKVVYYEKIADFFNYQCNDNSK